jgi:DNA-binding response OmpR family regulator
VQQLIGVPPTVAVLDDDIRFIRMVERVLNEQQIGVLGVTTLDLDEATRVIRESGCSIALVDVFMYGSAAGFDVVERLREDSETTDLRVIVTSGARRELGKRVGFLQQHDCDVLVKPFLPDELVARVLQTEPHDIVSYEARAVAKTTASPARASA